MLIQERLQIILKMHNLTPSAFADKLNVQRSNISHVLSGRNKPSLDLLEKIVNCYPRVNAHWLITGNVSLNSTEETIILKSETTEKIVQQEVIQKADSEVVRILEFYNDGTFKEFLPKKQ
jgi:transcriptional regulator with XRE-family HTH domain